MEKREENIFCGKGQRQMTLEEVTIFSSTEEPTVLLKLEFMEMIRMRVSITNHWRSFTEKQLIRVAAACFAIQSYCYWATKVFTIENSSTLYTLYKTFEIFY